jgi:hypothetical protein
MRNVSKVKILFVRHNPMNNTLIVMNSLTSVPKRGDVTIHAVDTKFREIHAAVLFNAVSTLFYFKNI